MLKVHNQREEHSGRGHAVWAGKVEAMWQEGVQRGWAKGTSTGDVRTGIRKTQWPKTRSANTFKRVAGGQQSPRAKIGKNWAHSHNTRKKRHLWE